MFENLSRSCHHTTHDLSIFTAVHIQRKSLTPWHNSLSEKSICSHTLHELAIDKLQDDV